MTTLSSTLRSPNVTRGTVVLIAGIAGLLASPAMADGGGSAKDFAQIKTAEGCVVLWSYKRVLGETTFLGVSRFSYNGTGCVAGRPLNGEGTLTWVRTDGGQSGLGFSGRFNNGVLEGPVIVTSNGRFFQNDEYVGGCPDSDVSEGLCTPRGGMASSNLVDEADEAPSNQVSNSSISSKGSSPITTGGAACETVDPVRVVKNQGGKEGVTMYQYELRNNASCPLIGITLWAGKVSYERRLKPGQTMNFVCFTGLSHEPDCGAKGITDYTVRALVD